MNVKTIIKKVHEKGFKGCIKSLRIRSANLINKEIINYWKRQPIDKRLIVMESGGEITDNAYALYDYMGRNGYLKKYHVVWLVYVQRKNTRYNISIRIRRLCGEIRLAFIRNGIGTWQHVNGIYMIIRIFYDSIKNGKNK